MSAQTAIVAWIVSAMVAWSPPGREHLIPEAKETEEATMGRYEDIAKSLVQVTYNTENNPVFSGDFGRARTTMLLLSIAYFESGFRRDVDLGLGKVGSGDHGRSHCLLQINMGVNRTDTTYLQHLIGKEWSVNDLLQDRTKCFFTGFSMVTKSFVACRSLPLEERLAGYASGDCSKGRDESKTRIEKARRWFSGHAPPEKDAAVISEMKSQDAVEPVIFHP